MSFGFKPTKGVEDAIIEGIELFSKSSFKIKDKNLNLKQMIKSKIV
jgi:hypothetical protein